MTKLSVDSFADFPVAPAPTALTPKVEWQPTAEQRAIVEAAKNTNDNLIIQALAGAAKTSTLLLIANALPTTSMLCLAFNTRIAKEMSAKLPSTCVAKTLNSVGHSAWAKQLNKARLIVNKDKTYQIVQQLFNEIENPKIKSALYKQMADIMRTVDLGKTYGWVPDGHHPQAKRLLNDDQFFDSLEEELSDEAATIVQVATLRSMEKAFKGEIDFNDQIFMPTIFQSSFPQFPVVLVDEAQDLSSLNHAMLRLIARKRLIAVGDECQSIYGFRGAHHDSMTLLQKEFDMTEFVLSISFRCPKEVVKEAQWRAPHMRWADNAAEGKVKVLQRWDEQTPADYSAILCRNNAPLFSLAVKMLKNGRYPELVGNDIGKGLIKILKSLGKPDMIQSSVIAAIEHWKDTKLPKSRNKNKIHDQAQCLLIFAYQGATLGEAMGYLEHILSVAGPVKLMTGHKSKGLEFEDVLILDEHLIGPDQQDENLRYVMQTRSKSTLTYVTSALFEDEDGDE
jgi:DNA helicase II / ATP-dependent DNA helicase PcrA